MKIGIIFINYIYIKINLVSYCYTFTIIINAFFNQESNTQFHIQQLVFHDLNSI